MLLDRARAVLPPVDGADDGPPDRPLLAPQLDLRGVEVVLGHALAQLHPGGRAQLGSPATHSQAEQEQQPAGLQTASIRSVTS